MDIVAHGVTGDPNDGANWPHAPCDAAFAAIESPLDDDARRRAIGRCERLIEEEVPYAPVWCINRARLVHPTVQGWRKNALQHIDWAALSRQAPWHCFARDRAGTLDAGVRRSEASASGRPASSKFYFPLDDTGPPVFQRTGHVMPAALANFSLRGPESLTMGFTYGTGVRWAPFICAHLCDLWL